MFWRGVLGYLPVNIVQGLVGLATIVVFTRLMSADAFGAYALGFAVMTLAHSALFTWNEAAMARFWVAATEAGDSEHQAATVHHAWLMFAGGLPLLALAAWAWPMSAELKTAILAGLFAAAPRSLIKIVQERRRAAGEVAGAAWLEIVQTLGGFLIGAALAWGGFGGASPLLGLGIAAAVCLPIVARGELAKARGGRVEPDRLRRHASYGVPISLSLMLALALSSLDRFMLASFLDEAAVGVYHAGYSLANRTLDVLFIWLGAASGPALIAALERGGRDALGEQAGEQVSIMVFLTLPAAVGLALVATPLAHLLIGPSLAAPAAKVTPWIAASGFLGGLTTYYLHQAFVLGRRTQMLLAAMAVPAAANFLLNLVLIPRFGVEGAVWSTLASYALGAVASAALGRTAIGLPLPFGDFARTAAACAIMAAVVWQVPAWGGIGELAAKAAVGMVVFAIAAWMLNAAQVRSRAAHAFKLLKVRTA